MFGLHGYANIGLERGHEVYARRLVVCRTVVAIGGHPHTEQVFGFELAVVVRLLLLLAIVFVLVVIPTNANVINVVSYVMVALLDRRFLNPLGKTALAIAPTVSARTSEEVAPLLKLIVCVPIAAAMRGVGELVSASSNWCRTTVRWCWFVRRTFHKRLPTVRIVLASRAAYVFETTNQFWSGGRTFARRSSTVS